MTIVLNGTTGITNDGGYTGDGIIFADTTPANTLVTTTGGNVGIGTSSLSNGVRTVIQGSQTGGAPQTSGTNQTYGVLRLQGTSFTSVLDFGTNGGNYNWIQATDSANLATNYNLVLNPNGGNLLVGATSGNGRVNSSTGSFNIGNTNAISYAAFVASGGYGGGVSLLDGTQGYTMWAQTSGADFYIRRSTTSGTFTGGVYISNAAGSWSAVSDERLKNILRPIENATEKLLTLRCIVGEYKDQVGSEHPFLIAQDVQAVFPEVVNTFGNEGHLGMSYTDMVPILVKAIQELKAIVDAQGAEIAALKGTQP